MGMHKGCVAGERSHGHCCGVPEGRLDDVRPKDAEHVMQNLGMHLETRLVEGVCKTEVCNFSRP